MGTQQSKPSRIVERGVVVVHHLAVVHRHRGRQGLILAGGLRLLLERARGRGLRLGDVLAGGLRLFLGRARGYDLRLSDGGLRLLLGRARGYDLRLGDVLAGGLRLLLGCARGRGLRLSDGGRGGVLAISGKGCHGSGGQAHGQQSCQGLSFPCAGTVSVVDRCMFHRLLPFFGEHPPPVPRRHVPTRINYV